MTELNNVKISVIMSNYNCEQYVGRAIKSVLGQTYKNFEFIIIDDCSTDSSRDIIDSFKDTRIKKVFFKKNEHMCYAFNYAISIAEGEYYAWIGDDDHWHPDKLKKQIEYMEMNLECGVCFTLVNVVDEDENILTEQDTDLVNLFKVKNRSQAEWIRYFYFNGCCLCHPSAFVRKEVIDKLGAYNYSLVQIQDFELWTRIAKNYDIYIIQEKLTNYRWFKSGKNFSAPSEKVNIRSNAEITFLLSRYFDDISDELFVECFSGDFVKKNARTHEELMCEKALMLLKPACYGYSGKIGGIIKLANLIQQDSTRKILRENYDITQKNIYELTMVPILCDGVIAARLDHYEEQKGYIRQLETGQKQQQEYIYNLESNLKTQNEYIQEIDEIKSNQQEYIAQLEEEQKSQQEYIDSLEKDLENQKEYIQKIDKIETEQQAQIDNLEQTLAVQNKYVSNLENLIEKYIDGQHKR